MRGILVAVSPEGVIGLDGDLPWHYSADLKRFKRLTVGTTILMGRHTWESLKKKPLPDRRNIVITRTPIEGVECFESITSALASVDGDVWFIGGARIYEEAMRFADVIDVTYVPDHIHAPHAVRFPDIDEALWEAGPLDPLPEDDRLKHRVFRRKMYA